jgi:hypothetical protein
MFHLGQPGSQSTKSVAYEPKRFSRPENVSRFGILRAKRFRFDRAIPLIAFYRHPRLQPRE